MSFREIKSLAKDHTSGEYIAFLDSGEKGVGGCLRSIPSLKLPISIPSFRGLWVCMSTKFAIPTTKITHFVEKMRENNNSFVTYL